MTASDFEPPVSESKQAGREIYTSSFNSALHKCIWKINLSGHPSVVDTQADHQMNCSPRYNRSIFLKVVNSLHFSVSYGAKNGFQISQSSIWISLDFESPCAGENIDCSWERLLVPLSMFHVAPIL
jgi:hypothetical protein